MSGRLPASASVATAGEGDKLHAPAAERNAQAITHLLALNAPAAGRALEIASGTGQHVVAFAEACPNLRWQPSELDAARLASIEAYRAEADRDNVAPALRLDACTPGWGKRLAAHDLIVLINLMHLISADACQTLIGEAARNLLPGGTFFIYGPFKRTGHLTSEGDVRFDAHLRAANPQIGYKDTDDIEEWLACAGFKDVTRVEMPANNLAVIARR